MKSVCEHASLGIDDSSVVAARERRADVLDARRAEFGGDWFAERFVPGRELNVARHRGAGRAARAARRRDPLRGLSCEQAAIVGYAAKWDADSFEYRNTVRSFGVEPELAARAARLALACWELFALDGYARVDFRVDAQRHARTCSRSTPIPACRPMPGSRRRSQQAGIGYGDAIGWLIADARRRAARPGAPA